jgi:hypothetical protein
LATEVHEHASDDGGGVWSCQRCRRTCGSGSLRGRCVARNGRKETFWGQLVVVNECHRANIRRHRSVGTLMSARIGVRHDDGGEPSRRRLCDR